jgi:hypothetical protein
MTKQKTASNSETFVDILWVKVVEEGLLRSWLLEASFAHKQATQLASSSSKLVQSEPVRGYKYWMAGILSAKFDEHQSAPSKAWAESHTPFSDNCWQRAPPDRKSEALL